MIESNWQKHELYRKHYIAMNPRDHVGFPHSYYVRVYYDVTIATAAKKITLHEQNLPNSLLLTSKLEHVVAHFYI